MEGRGRVQTRPYRTHYSAGTLVTNIALPDANQAFTGWAGDTNGAVFLDPSRFVLTMNTSKVVTAHFTIRPRLEVVRCLGELSRDGFDLRLTGDLGERYLIQTTRELASTPNVMLWTDLGALTNTLGMVEFLDTTNTNFTQRFYRAEEAP